MRSSTPDVFSPCHNRFLGSTLVCQKSFCHTRTARSFFLVFFQDGWMGRIADGGGEVIISR